MNSLKCSLQPVLFYWVVITITVTAVVCKPVGETKTVDAPRGYSWNLMLPRSYFLVSPPSSSLKLGPVPVPSNTNKIHHKDGSSRESKERGRRVATGAGAVASEENNKNKPTFIPYIGARALSNMKEFFDHLKDNLFAIKLKEFIRAKAIGKKTIPGGSGGGGGGGTGSQSSKDMSQFLAQLPPLSAPVGTPVPDDEEDEERSGEAAPAAGMSSKKFQSYANLFEYTKDFYHPHWKVTNLGLGRRK